MASSSANRWFFAAAALVSLAPATADALDRRVRIVNDSKHTIVSFFSTNVGVRDWNESLLGDDALKPGTSVVLDLEDGSGYCRYRFRAIFEDGVELVRQSVNVCEVGTYKYTD